MPKIPTTDQPVTLRVLNRVLNKKLKTALKPYVTKSHLARELKKLATKKYLDDNFATKKYLDSNFATKKYLSDELFKYNTLIAADFKQARLEREELRDEMKALRRERLTDMSLLMGELKTIREEIALFGYRQSQHGKQLDHHETRIGRVEHKLDLATV